MSLISGSSATHRDRIFIYIIKDLILKLVEWGERELNQTSLTSFCRLNLKNHRSILDGMEANGLIARREEEADGKKVTTIYKSPQKGFNFLLKYLNRMKKDVSEKNKKGDKRIYRQTQTLMLLRLYCSGWRSLLSILRLIIHDRV